MHSKPKYVHTFLAKTVAIKRSYDFSAIEEGMAKKWIFGTDVCFN